MFGVKFKYNICTCKSSLHHFPNYPQRVFKYNICTCKSCNGPIPILNILNLNTTFVHVNRSMRWQQFLKEADLNTTFVHVNLRSSCVVGECPTYLNTTFVHVNLKHITYGTRIVKI